MIDDLAITDYFQDADSFGWAILALFSVGGGSSNRRRWGVLDCLTGTQNGASHAHVGEKIVGFEAGSREEAIRRHWHLVDWHRDEEAARAALVEARSRRW